MTREVRLRRRWTFRTHGWHVVMVKVGNTAGDLDRPAPIDLPSLPPDSGERLLTGDGTVEVTHEDASWVRLG
jgi:hypothetical protein